MRIRRTREVSTLGLLVGIVLLGGVSAPVRAQDASSAASEVATESPASTPSALVSHGEPVSPQPHPASVGPSEAASPTAAEPTQIRFTLDNGYSDSTPGLGTLPTSSVPAGVPWSVAVGAQVFGQYELLFPAGADWNHRFTLPRAWMYLAFRVENAVGRVLVEGARAIDDGALSGIADDSLLFRVREAWGGYRVADLVEMRVGLVPTLLTPWLTQHWYLRGVGRIGLREFDLLAPADLGASTFIDLPEGFGRVGVSYTNGEGYSSRELNRGKNLEVAADVHPLAFVPELRFLALVLGYTNGSLGAGSARSDRIVGGVLWDQREIGAGVSTSYLLGLSDRGEREGLLVDAWARGLLFEHLVLGAQVLHLARDVSSGNDTLTSLTLTVGARIIDQIRVYLAVDGRFADALARVASPAWERWDARLVVEADVVARFFGAL